MNFTDDKIIGIVKNVPENFSHDGWKLICGLNSNRGTSTSKMISWKIVDSSGYNLEDIKKVISCITRKLKVYWIADLDQFIYKFL